MDATLMRPILIDLDAIYTTGQTAKKLKVAPRTVTKWFDSGRLKGYRMPGSEDRRIPGSSLLAFCRAHDIPAAPKSAGFVLAVALERAELPGLPPDALVFDTFYEAALGLPGQLRAALIGDGYGLGVAVQMARHVLARDDGARVVLLLSPDAVPPAGIECRTRPVDIASILSEIS